MKKRVLCCSLLLVSAALAAPVLAAGLTPIQQLGKVMYQDRDFSRNKTQSCQTCHHHISGFADPTNLRDPYNTMVSLGDDGVSKGGRNAPTSAYAGFSPALSKIAEGQYVGGMFWDGRATGLSKTLGDPLAEQAQGPPLNPVEMNMPDKKAVVDEVRNATYANLFGQVFGPASFNDVDLAYDNIARAIAAYERSIEVQSFSSRFDAGQLSAQEIRGLEQFKVNCAQCHSLETTLAKRPPLFTNYTYANIGVPTNPRVATEPDLGLGGFLASAEAPEEFAADADTERGKFKVPTLRNVAFTAPYSHNGYFPTLKDIVQFKNSRDGWPAPDVAENLNIKDLGNLGLTEGQVDDIVAFLLTLTDK